MNFNEVKIRVITIIKMLIWEIVFKQFYLCMKLDKFHQSRKLTTNGFASNSFTGSVYISRTNKEKICKHNCWTVTTIKISPYWKPSFADLAFRYPQVFEVYFSQEKLSGSSWILGGLEITQIWLIKQNSGYRTRQGVCEKTDDRKEQQTLLDSYYIQYNENIQVKYYQQKQTQIYSNKLLAFIYFKREKNILYFLE